ncbi:unnamed protein product [Phytophthora fragariaefolia]|uniref:Unnamed protein product n=1 Tax=Phytophthora fragariaefolia TaxID=1490495 RepID=A0A9W6WNH2_9STRA|nr:unnamed protein product [Phytophthora fragariaefolia]
MVRVPGSAGDSRFHREANQEDVGIKLEPEIDAPVVSGSPQPQLREEGSTEGQITGRSSDRVKEEGLATDLEDKPLPPPQAPLRGVGARIVIGVCSKSLRRPRVIRSGAEDDRRIRAKPIRQAGASGETEKLTVTQAAERMTESSPYASAHASVTSEKGSETSGSVIQERLPLGWCSNAPSAKSHVQGRVVASTRDQGHPSRMQTFFDAAMDCFLKEQQTTGARSATNARKALEMPDVNRESVGSRHDPLGEFDPNDLSIDVPRRAAVASAETSTNAGVAAPRIQVSAISKLKELKIVREAGWASNWKCLLEGFLVQYCGRVVSVARQYYHARKRSDESPLEYLHRLNVAGMRAKLPIKDGSAAAHREHVEHFIETLNDRELADQLALLRLADADVLEDTLRARQRAKSRQGRAAMRSSKFRQKAPTTPNPTPAKDTRAVRAIRTMEDSSESEQESGGSETEDHVRQVYLAAANESEAASNFHQSRQDSERSADRQAPHRSHDAMQPLWIHEANDLGC